MKNLSAEEALRVWERSGALSPKKAKELRALLEDKAEDIGVSKGIVIFATIGACLVGLGILLFVGSHWKEMGSVHRVIVLFAGYGLIALGAHVTEQRKLPRVAESLWFLTVLMLGANIFLLGQIFHFSLTFWQGPFLWMIGALAMGVAREKAAYAALAVPLFLLALGWFGGGSGWFMDDQVQFLYGDEGLRPLFPLIGTGFIALAALIRGKYAWMDVSLVRWGALLVAVPLILTTAESSIAAHYFDAEFTLKQLCIIGASLLVVAGVFIKYGSKRRDTCGSLLALTLISLLVVVHYQGSPLVGSAVAFGGVVYVLYILLIFMLSLLSTWYGVRTGNRTLVNAGVVSSSILIIIQYFSWSFQMLHSSIAFIVGGIVLIALSIFMEKTRRKLLASIA